MDWDGEVESRVRSDRALFSLTSSPSRRPDGKPDLGNGTPVSIAHGGDLTLVVAGSPGCDLEPVVSRDVQVWCDLLGTNAFAVANVIAQETGESLDMAATRLWTVKECLKNISITSKIAYFHDGQLGFFIFSESFSNKSYRSVSELIAK